MKRLMLFVLVGIAGCGQQQPTPTKYQHSLQATASEDRLKAIQERESRFGVKSTASTSSTKP